MTIKDRIKNLEYRVEEIENFILEQDERLERSTRVSFWLSVAGMFITLLVGILQAAATWYK